MRVYISMKAIPWEDFTMNVPDPAKPGQVQTIRAHSTAKNAGFLPLFWSQEEAEKTFPGCQVGAIDLPDDWNPMVNHLRQQAESKNDVADQDLEIVAAE